MSFPKPVMRLPSIKEMEQGLPCLIDVEPQLRWPYQGHRLDSFQDFVWKAREAQHASLCSPDSTKSTMHTPTEARHPTSCHGSQRGQSAEHCSFPPTPKASLPEIEVPSFADISCGGWFDRTNWIYLMILDEVGHMDLDELHEKLWYREDRPTYGENHTSTRSKKSGDIGTPTEDGCTLVYGSQLSVQKHQELERDRRDRHRYLQRMSDLVIGTFIYRLAEEKLPEIKQTISGMADREAKSDALRLPLTRKAQPSNAPVKKTGKDDQLVAAVFFAHFCAYVILREHQARIDVERENVRLQHEIRIEQDARMEAEQRTARLEQLLEQHNVHQRDSLLPDRPTSRPVPTLGRKRTATEAGLATIQPAAGIQDNEQHTQHRWLGVEHSHRSCGHLPPSPSPSCHECSSSFCTC